MKKFLFPALAVAFFTCSMPGFSQSTLKFGHVDIAKLLAALPARDSAAAVLDKETKQMQSTYDEMTTAYNKMLDDYEQERTKLTETVRKNKEAELMDKEKRLREYEQNASETLQKRNGDLIQPILDKILKAVDQVAAANGFTYILDVSKGSVVYTSKDSQNIDSLVLKILKPENLQDKNKTK